LRKNLENGLKKPFFVISRLTKRLFCGIFYRPKNPINPSNGEEMNAIILGLLSFFFCGAASAGAVTCPQGTKALEVDLTVDRVELKPIASSVGPMTFDPAGFIYLEFPVGNDGQTQVYAGGQYRGCVKFERHEMFGFNIVADMVSASGTPFPATQILWFSVSESGVGTPVYAIEQRVGGSVSWNGTKLVLIPFEGITVTVWDASRP